MSSTPATLRVCGVPEHFNLPWQFAIEKGQFAANNVRNNILVILFNSYLTDMSYFIMVLC